MEPWRKMHLGNDKGGAAVGIVDGHVEPSAEHVLVVLCVDAGGDQGAVFGVLLSGAQQVGAQLARELDLVLDRPVLLEVPVEEIPGQQPQLSR